MGILLANSVATDITPQVLLKQAFHVHSGQECGQSLGQLWLGPPSATPRKCLRLPSPQLNSGHTHRPGLVLDEALKIIPIRSPNAGSGSLCHCLSHGSSSARPANSGINRSGPHP